MSQHRPSAARLCAVAIVAAASIAAAVPWDASKPTPTSFDIHGNELGWTPKPTTLAGELPGMELFKRQAPAMNLCGYITKDRADSVTCGSTYTCVFNINNRAADCCVLSSSPGTATPTSIYDCAFATTCVPYANITSCGSDCLANPYITKCIQQFPYCYTYTFADIGYEYYGCGSRSAYISSVYISYDGMSGSRAPVYVNAVATITSSSITRSRTTSTPGSLTSSDPATTTTIPPTTSPAKKDANLAGPIAGGVVGGLAVIGIFVGVLLYWRSQRKPDNPPQTYQQPPPGQTQMGTYYDPRSQTQSVYSPVVPVYNQGGSPYPAYQSGEVKPTYMSPVQQSGGVYEAPSN